MYTISKLNASKGLELHDIPMPILGPNDVLIKVIKTGICGTDLHIYDWDAWAKKTIPVPLTIGHEFVGRVESVGDQVAHLKKGDRVVAEGHIFCGECYPCKIGQKHLCRKIVGLGINRPGAFAEYVALPASNVISLPDMISDDIAAIMDPLGNATHTALSFDLKGKDVLVTGAGPIGTMSAVIAKHAGARNVVVTDINAYRLSLAQKLGLEHCINVAEENLDDVMKQLDIEGGFHVGLEMSGSIQALQQMIDHMINGGYMALLGILPVQGSIDWTKVIFKGLFLKGIYGREIFHTWHQTIDLLQNQLDIAPLITHHFKAQNFQEGFEVMGTGESGKVILDWS